MGKLETATMIAKAVRSLDGLCDYLRSAEAPHARELTGRARQLKQALEHRLEIIRRPEPRVAFVAPKGVGKSTLINALADLWLDDKAPPKGASGETLNLTAMLPLGTGGTTPCEIRVEAGPWEVDVEPESKEEAEALFRQFAEWAWAKAHKPNRASAGSGCPAEVSDSVEEEHFWKLEPDLERVVRGMTELGESKEKTFSPSGTRKFTNRCAAVELATKYSQRALFVAEVVRRASLDHRKRTQWLPEGDAIDARKRLREVLRDLFRGAIPGQPFPKRVTVRVPSTGVRWRESDVPLIDTLGISAVWSRGDGESGSLGAGPLGERKDLREILKTPWTVVVIGADFSEPPNPSVRLLEQMIEDGIHFGETLENRTVVAIVDRGVAGDGYDDADTNSLKKEDRCAENMIHLGCPRGTAAGTWTEEAAKDRVFCVNVLDGGIKPFRRFLANAIERMADGHEKRLQEGTRDAQEFLQNLPESRRSEIRGQVIPTFQAHLSEVADKQAGKMSKFRSNLLQPFADRCRARGPYPATLRSLVVNRGKGKGPSAWAILEDFTAKELQELLNPLREIIEHTSLALRKYEMYQEERAQDVISEEADRRLRIFDGFCESFMPRFVEATVARLLDDDSVWESCDSEWGKRIDGKPIRDPSYKERVACHFEKWGEDHSPVLLAAIVDAELKKQAGEDDSGMLCCLIDGIEP